ncbi:MAG: hypothetical protein E7662_00970 [Ruminococcaceae bacterium]|nr:hypothetical protein [Oscillospiraceae bacterium]
MCRVRLTVLLLICMTLSACARFSPAEISVHTPETAAAVHTDSHPSGESTAYTYVINKSSGKFHLPTCGGVTQMKEANRENTSESRNALIESGYKPCGTCNP